MIEVEQLRDAIPDDEHVRELERNYRAVVEEILELRGDDGRVAAFLRSISEPGALADTSGYSPDISLDRQAAPARDGRRAPSASSWRSSSSASGWPSCRSASASATTSSQGANAQQREYFLRKQMESIRKELGEDDASSSRSTSARSPRRRCPTRFASRPSASSAGSSAWASRRGESSMIRTYLDWLLGVPWGERSDEKLDPVQRPRGARRRPRRPRGRQGPDHRVHRRPGLRRERGIVDEGRGAGAILTLIGPPGTGKTSIGESIARATGREFVRMSLGGVRDEAEIRGHRRTYIGALPGRLVRALKDAGTINPVIMLDEVDKVGADWRGDPSSALLEVLDPAQNHSFRDHYLDVELDLSEVLFIATANVAETIPGPLLDRMEVVRFDGYTTDEKVAIARGYLWPRQIERNGLRDDEVEISDELLRADRHRVHPRGGRARARARARQAAAKDGDADRLRAGERAGRDRRGRRPRRASASSASSRRRPSARRSPASQPDSRSRGAGGDVLFIETTSMPGKEGFVLTGQLGDVMKESARIALSYVRGHADAARPRRRRVRRPRVPHPRPRGSDPEGRPERRDHDDHGAGLAAHRPPGQAHGRDDRRGHASRAGCCRSAG